MQMQIDAFEKKQQKIPFFDPWLPFHLPVLPPGINFGFDLTRKERRQWKWREKQNKFILGFWPWGVGGKSWWFKKEKGFSRRVGQILTLQYFALNAVFRTPWALETCLNCQEQGSWGCSRVWYNAVYRWSRDRGKREGKTMLTPFLGEIPYKVTHPGVSLDPPEPLGKTDI